MWTTWCRAPPPYSWKRFSMREECFCFLYLCLYFVIFWPDLCRVADVQLFPPVKDGSYNWILHENRIDALVIVLFMTCTPRHHPTSRPHFRPLLQECSESPQAKRTLWAFSRKRMKQKIHLLTEKLVNAHLKPTSRVRQNTSHRCNWLICGVFDQVSNFQSTSTNSTQHCYHDDLQAPLPREWPYS